MNYLHSKVCVSITYKKLMKLMNKHSVPQQNKWGLSNNIVEIVVANYFG